MTISWTVLRDTAAALGLTLLLATGAGAQEAPAAAETVVVEETEAPSEAAVDGQRRAVAEAPVASGPKRIVVVGDNLAFGVTRDIEEALSEVSDLTVERLAVGSSGLVRDDFYDWPAELKTILETPTTAVVLLIGANDRQQLRDEKGRHDPNSEDWLRLYKDRVAALAAIPKAAGVPLFWVEMPIMKSGSLTSTLKLTNAIFRAETEAAEGTFIETWDQFADETGSYARSGPDLTGTPKRLRTGDGIHFTKAGYDVLAHVIAKALLQMPALAGDSAAEQAEVEAMMLGSVDMPPEESAPAPEVGATAEPGTVPPVAAETAPATEDAPSLAALPDTVGADAPPPAQAEAAPVRTQRPTVREVRIGRPFLLTQPQEGEAALVTGSPTSSGLLTPVGETPAARADSTSLPTY